MADSVSWTKWALGDRRCTASRFHLRTSLVSSSCSNPCSSSFFTLIIISKSEVPRRSAILKTHRKKFYDKALSKHDE